MLVAHHAHMHTWYSVNDIRTDCIAYNPDSCRCIMHRNIACPFASLLPIRDRKLFDGRWATVPFFFVNANVKYGETVVSGDQDRAEH